MKLCKRRATDLKAGDRIVVPVTADSEWDKRGGMVILQTELSQSVYEEDQEVLVLEED